MCGTWATPPPWPTPRSSSLWYPKDSKVYAFSATARGKDGPGGAAQGSSPLTLILSPFRGRARIFPSCQHVDINFFQGGLGSCRIIHQSPSTRGELKIAVGSFPLPVR